jgi:hypothetical protein
MTEITHGLISGLIWSAIFGTFLVAIAEMVSRAVPPRARTRNMEMRTTGACDESRIPVVSACVEP